MKLTVLEAYTQKVDAGIMFSSAPKSKWQHWVEHDANNLTPLSCRSLLLEAAGCKVLFEAGLGFLPDAATKEQQQAPHGLQKSLEALNIGCDEVDFVFLSHLHFDHAAAVLAEPCDPNSFELIFPKAQFIVGAAQFAHAEHPHAFDRHLFLPQLCPALKNSKRLFLLNGRLPQGMPPGVGFFCTQGHTPGQVHAVICAESTPSNKDLRFLVFCADLVPGLHWVPETRTMGFDHMPCQLISEKQILLKHCRKHKGFLFFTHDPKYLGCWVEDQDRLAPTNAIPSEFQLER